MPKFKVKLLEYLNKQHKTFFVLLGILLAILVSIIDYLTLDYFVFEFYLLPIVITVWFSGRKTGIFMAFVTAITEILVDIITTPYHSSRWTHLWNFCLNLSFFIAVVYLLEFLRRTLINLKNVSESKENINRQLQVEIEYHKHAEESLKEMNERKSIFVANVSHELRNPLGIIREVLDLVVEGLSGKIDIEQEIILETGKNTVERLIRLTNNLLDISRIEAGKIDLKREEIEIGLLVDEIVVSYNIVISQKQLNIRRYIPDDLGLLWGDKDKIFQVISNLFGNAIKYTPLDGNITIEVFGTNNEIRFEISDTGVGIAKEEIGKLFNKFERIFAEKQEGTGLGLSIAKDIIELHKGKIWIESEVGKGSKFIFILPRDFRK